MVSSHSFVIDPTLTSASQGVLWPQDPLRRLIRMGTNPLKCSVPDEMWGRPFITLVGVPILLRGNHQFVFC